MFDSTDSESSDEETDQFKIRPEFEGKAGQKVSNMVLFKIKLQLHWHVILTGLEKRYHMAYPGF